MLDVNGKSVKFELDSGAAVTVMSKKEAVHLFPGTIIHHTNLQLISYCNRALQSLGFIEVTVKYKTAVKRLNIYIISGKRKLLLGREWIRQLFNESDFWDCNASVNTVFVSYKSKLKSLLEKYKSVYCSEFSAIMSIQAKLNLM